MNTLQDPRGPDRHWHQEAASPEEAESGNRQTRTGGLAAQTRASVSGRNDAFAPADPVHLLSARAGLQQCEGCSLYIY